MAWILIPQFSFDNNFEILFLLRLIYHMAFN